MRPDTLARPICFQPRRFLFNLHWLYSHILPFLGVAKELWRRGHEVALVSPQGAIFALAIEAGLDCQVFVPIARPAGLDAGRGARTHLRNPAFVANYRAYYNEVFVPDYLVGLRKVVADFMPDVICTDSFSPVGAVAAQLEGCPWISASVLLTALAEPTWCEPFVHECDQLGYSPLPMLERYGVSCEVKGGTVLSPILNTFFTTAELVAKPDWPSGLPLQLIGAPRIIAMRAPTGAFAWEKLRADRTLIYASSGTLQSFPDGFLDRVAEAIDPATEQLVVSHYANEKSPMSAEHLLYAQCVPQPELLARARVVISHGGANTLAESLVEGVPMLVAPLGYDTRVQAELVERSGSGVVIDPATATTGEIRLIIDRLSVDGASERARAGAISESFRSSDSSFLFADSALEIAEREGLNR